MQNFSLKLSHWASKNFLIARFLIFFTETSRLFIAYFLGQGIGRKLDLNELSITIIGLISIVFVIYVRSKRQDYNYRQILIRNTIIASIAFCLSFLLGNVFNPDSENNRQVIYAGETITVKNSNLIDSLASSQPQKFDKLLKKQNDKIDTGRRVGYFFLFLLSLILTYFSLILFCSLACSGYGFFAVLALLLSHGIFSGGIYFLLKIFRKGYIKKYKELSKAERKKEWALYVKILLVFVSLAALYVIIQSIRGGF